MPYLADVSELLRCARPSILCVLGMPSMGQTASVLLRAVDAQGSAVPFKIESFTSVDHPGIELASHFQGTKISGLELGGSYKCIVATLQQPLVSSAATVVVNNLNTVAVISLRFLPAADFVTPPIARFIVRPSPVVDDEFIWVSVQPAFSTTLSGVDRLESTTVEKDGRFDLQGVHGGLYLMTFYRDGHVLATKFVEVPVLGTLGEGIELSLDQVH